MGAIGIVEPQTNPIFRTAPNDQRQGSMMAEPLSDIAPMASGILRPVGLSLERDTQERPNQVLRTRSATLGNWRDSAQSPEKSDRGERCRDDDQEPPQRRPESLW